MEADRSTGMYERAVTGIRRLVALGAERGAVDRVRDALERELRSVLDLERARIVVLPEDRAIDALGTPAERSADDHGCTPALQLRSPIRAHETVVVLAREPHRLGDDDAVAAAAVVDVAALLADLHDAELQAATDELTGCLNRRAALVRLREELARSQRAGSPVSCLMLDIDNLKQINDKFGHLEGDRVLREAGASLRGQLRAYDVAARYGGDEFLVLLPSAREHEAVQAGARMTAAVARIRPPTAGSATMPVAATFGAATWRPGDLPDTLLERADQALLAAKRRTHSLRPPRD